MTMRRGRINIVALPLGLNHPDRQRGLCPPQEPMDANSSGSRIRFGTFEVDLQSGELRNLGQRIRIQPQPMKVLAVLLERPGTLVTRDELRKRLWPDQLYVDFEHGLNRSINKLRRALLDDAGAPRYIETLSTRGYRFIAHIDVEAKTIGPSAIAPPAVADRESSTTHSNWRRRATLALVAFALGASLVVGIRRLASPRLYPAVPRLKLIPLVTFGNGFQCLPAFSPDGSRIAYSWNSDAGWYLEVKDVGSENRLRLTHTPGNYPPGPAWSPDGREIAFARAGESDDRGIFVISAMGGQERKIRSLAIWRVPQRIVSWSPDGRWIAFADEVRSISPGAPNGRGPNAIYLISPDTSETRQLTVPPAGDFGDAAPTFSPDGTTVAFVRTKANSRDEVYSVPVRGGTPRRLVTEGLWTNGLAWASDGKSIVFDRSLAGGFRLWTVSSTGSNPHPLDLPINGEIDLEPTIWRDRLAYESHADMRTIGRIALNGVNGGLPATPVASTRHEFGGRYSPDGNKIAFLSDRTGADELWLADGKGVNAIQLTNLRTPLIAVAWDPTGKSIAVSTYSGKVFWVSVETHASRLLFDGPPFTDETVPNIAISRDGKSIYILSQPGTGESYDLLNVPIEGGTPTRVLSGRPTNFAESADGQTLFYSRADGLWRRSLKGGPEQFVAPASGLWDLGADGLYLLTNSSTIEKYTFAGKHLRSVANLGDLNVYFPLSISPDARWALFGYEQRKTIEIDMVQGFN